MSAAGTPRLSSQATRATSVLVLPVPGPATTATRRFSVSAQATCSGLRPPGRAAAGTSGAAAGTGAAGAFFFGAAVRGERKLVWP